MDLSENFKDFQHSRHLAAKRSLAQEMSFLYRQFFLRLCLNFKRFFVNPEIHLSAPTQKEKGFSIVRQHLQGNSLLDQVVFQLFRTKQLTWLGKSAKYNHRIPFSWLQLGVYERKTILLPKPGRLEAGNTRWGFKALITFIIFTLCTVERFPSVQSHLNNNLKFKRCWKFSSSPELPTQTAFHDPFIWCSTTFKHQWIHTAE